MRYHQRNLVNYSIFILFFTLYNWHFLNHTQLGGNFLYYGTWFHVFHRYNLSENNETIKLSVMLRPRKLMR